jgi:rhamnose utilization protein RhaD (predicted bifunctional aldolase and dehydrogenase)/NAD(P)-dependent dehydrogenase (short-subunit alcohol dehydrogenase family)
LVLHGGGNTSVKTVHRDFDGTDLPVLHVKGSGWDMGTIDLPGLPAVRMDALLAMARLPALSDEDMVRLQRRALIDPSAPTPSVEAILHAILPWTYVDHTHANAIVSLSNQPDGPAILRDLFPDALMVPYVMPGFDLALACHRAMQDQTARDGMILLNHGIFTFADDPRDSYEQMIAMVAAATRRLDRPRAQVFPPAPLPAHLPDLAQIAPILRGALALPGPREDRPTRWILDHRSSPEIMAFCNGAALSDYATRGNVTPDHVIRIKRHGVALPAPDATDLPGFRQAVRTAIDTFKADYTAYFQRNAARKGGGLTMLDPAPRVLYVPGIGLFGLGCTRKDAAIAADLAEATVRVITDAERIGRFTPLSEEHLFDVEYWSLEQAKLAGARDKPMGRQIVAVTGAASGLGLAIARAFLAEGAEVAMLDISADLAARAAESGGLPVNCDVTDPASVAAAMAQVVARFGGLDVLISNAGVAVQGNMATVPDDAMTRALAINLWGHHYMARSAVAIMQAQGTGGAMVFNISKQALNPGPGFGPYGIAKSAALALMRQYAVEHGADGITSNAVNADRIRTGLLTEDMVRQRSQARGLSEADYMRGNLLQREVTVEDVAEAFVFLARAGKTSGAILTVDGGNVAAMVR